MASDDTEATATPAAVEVVKELERFREAIRAYAPGQRCHIEYDANARAFRAHLRVKERDQVEPARRVAEAFGHIIAHTFIDEAIPHGLIDEQLRGFDFASCRDLLARQLREIAAARSRPGESELFCLNVHLDLGNSYSFITWSSSAWRESFVNAKVEELRATGTGNPTMNRLYYSFNAYEQRAEVTEEIRDIVSRHGTVIENSYNRYGEAYLAAVSSPYAYCMIDTMTDAINLARSDFAAIPKSDDFVSALMLGDEDPHLQALALRRTLPPDALRIQFLWTSDYA